MADMKKKEKLLITGVTGYLGSSIAYKAILTNKYEVHGTVRDLEGDKVNEIKKAFNTAFDSLTLHKADLTNAQDWDIVIEKVAPKFVIHVASPFLFASSATEESQVTPAVEGTLAVIKASKKFGVRRVVITSSMSAMEAFIGKDITVDYRHWHDIYGLSNPYYKSKTLAESAAWKYFYELDEEDREEFELISINPGFITGKLLVKAESTSQSIISAILKNSFPRFPNINLHMVDIEDAVDAHLKALKCENANTRYPVYQSYYSLREIYEILGGKYNEHGFYIYYSDPSSCLFWMASRFNNDAYFYYKRWNTKCYVKKDHTEKNLKKKYKPIQESLYEMAESLMVHGFVPKGP